MTLDTENLAIPELDYDYFIDMNSTDFYNIMHEIQDISDGCEIKIKQKILQFRAEGIIGSVKISQNLATIKIIPTVPTPKPIGPA